ncbi:MAG TPA: YihY/virulence factor BrkB family protein [Actinomycetota bacterium]|nr:YihY/virulence factor BrkB family protein [Actinomycetota bacterium]
MKLVARFLAVFLFAKRYRAKRGEPAAPARPAPPPRPEPAPRAAASPAAPDTPADLPASDWKTTVKRALKEVKDDRATLAAAGMAYYFFLAIFPATIAAIGILDLMGTSTAGLVNGLRDALPGTAGQMLVDAVQGRDPSQSDSLVAAITGVALALWSASSGFVALQSGLNVAYDVPADRKFAGKRAVAFALLVATALLGGVPTPFLEGEGAVKALGWALTVPAVVLLFAFFYWLGPKRESPRFVWVTPGGVAGALLWLAVSGAFGWYVGSDYASYGKTYGSLAGVIILILWLYLSSLTILVGGELNAEVESHAERKGGSPQS